VTQATISILREDEHLLVVDKPAGLLTVPAPGRSGRTLAELVAATLRERGAGERSFPVHRLDEETSGAVLFAKTEAARDRLEEVFAAHDLIRVYHAVVIGRPHPAGGVIRSRLQEDQGGRVREGDKAGREAVTYYRTLRVQGEFALVECELETGRRNQIRVHLSQRGWPIVGDRKYGVFHGHKKDLSRRARRTLLHATGLALAHPDGTGRLAVVAPLPEEFTPFVPEPTCKQLQHELRRRLGAPATP
jgi:23S rRNA pseudouridine1911/1915/1917 synthase